MPVNSIREDLMKEGRFVDRLHWQGTKSPGMMFEVCCYTRRIRLAQNVEMAQAVFNPKLPWADVHFEERVGGKPMNPDPSHKMWARTTDDYKMDEEKFSHTYSERMWPKASYLGIRFEVGDLNTLVQMLRKDPFTRQAYMPMFMHEDLTAGINQQRVPCSLGWQFIINQGQLDVMYPMRSCDAFRHLQNDLYLANRLALWVRDKSGIRFPLGQMLFTVGNLHCFEADIELYRKGLIK